MPKKPVKKPVKPKPTEKTVYKRAKNKRVYKIVNGRPKFVSNEEAKKNGF